MQDTAANISKNINSDDNSAILISNNTDKITGEELPKEPHLINKSDEQSHLDDQKLNDKSQNDTLNGETETIKQASVEQKQVQEAEDKNSSEVSEPKESKPKEKAGKRFHNWLKENFCSETEVVGVEVQPDAIRICQATNDGKKWNIDKLFSAETLKAHDYESLKKNKAVYSKSLKEAFKKNKISNKNVALSIPASLAIIRTISLPLMTRENLAKATKIQSFWQNLVQLSGDISDYSIFYKIVNESEEKKEMEIK